MEVVALVDVVQVCMQRSTCSRRKFRSLQYTLALFCTCSKVAVVAVVVAAAAAQATTVCRPSPASSRARAMKTTTQTWRDGSLDWVCPQA